MRGTRTGWMKGAAGAAVLALSLSACGGGDSKTDGGSGGEGGGGGIVRANGTEPERKLIPADTAETGGGKVVASLFSQLVEYDDKGQEQMDVAESIETSDKGKTWTIKLKKDRKFADGTPVTAKSFVDAWNWGAHVDNAAKNAYFFEPIEGYADVHPEDEKAKPKAKEMKGLKVVDDHTFTVTLSAPQSGFKQRLGYTAYSPLPESFFKDPKAFGDKPVGNGPYAFESWENNKSIKLKKNPEYVGDFGAKNDGIEFTIYAQQDAAYSDLQANNLDVLDAIPEGAMATFESELGDRAVNQPSGVFQSFTFPMYADEPWAKMDEKGAALRTAISMAINREEITKAIFNGTRTPAKDFSSPVITGYSDEICGEACTYDPEKAKQLLAKAGGYDGTLTIAYNNDGGHKAWVDAACNSIKNAINIKCEGKAYPDFKSLLADRSEQKMKGAFRSGWQMDYPGLDNFLTPLYVTGASSNDGKYSNKEFDAKVKAGDTAATPEEAVKLYQEAEKILLKDMPTVPLWYSNITGGWSENVSNVRFDVFGVPVFSEITVNNG